MAVRWARLRRDLAQRTLSVTLSEEVLGVVSFGGFDPGLQIEFRTFRAEFRVSQRNSGAHHGAPPAGPNKVTACNQLTGCRPSE